MSEFPPTDEQQAVIDAVRTGGNVVCKAAAGTGKTSTMVLVGEDRPHKRGLYLAFNRQAALDAKTRMPRGVTVMTTMAIARLHIVTVWGEDTWNNRMNTPRQDGRAVARILGVRGGHRISADRVLAPKQVVRVVADTVERFAYSADSQVEFRHLAQVNGVGSYDERKALADLVLPIARRYWTDVSQPGSELKMTFDIAMKLWATSNRTNIPFDYVVLDEAQDTNPVLSEVVARQHCQTIIVGDAYQQMYAWRGAENAIDLFVPRADRVCKLQQSFRFGPRVADEANKWLTVLDADLRVKGWEPAGSRVGPIPDGEPVTVLSRTNASAIGTVLTEQAAGKRVAFVGGKQAAKPIRQLAEAADQLKDSGQTWHPDLCAFTSWSAVQDYVESDHGGADLAVLVNLVDEHGTDAIKRAADATVDEWDAQVVVSTAHKSKGGEWDNVRIATDFKEPTEDESGRPGEIRPDDAMVAYVAVTRAKKRLDREGLAWVDKHLAGHRPMPQRPVRPAPPAPAPAPARVVDFEGPDWLAVAGDAPLSALIGTGRES